MYELTFGIPQSFRGYKQRWTCKKAGIQRRTLFRVLSPEENPTLENHCQIVEHVPNENFV